MSLNLQLARLSDASGAAGLPLPLANRNYIVDGNFESWTSTGSTTVTTSPGPATMYYTGQGTGGTAAAAQAVFTTGYDPIGATSPIAYALNFTQTVASTGTPGSSSPFIMQRIESVRTLSGRSATFSCWLYTTSGTITIPVIGIMQSFGTGGSPSAAAVTNKSVNWVLTTIPKRFSVRLDIPSTVGKTLGTNGNDYLEPVIWLPANVTFSIVTAQWQLEESSPYSSSDINGNGGAPTAFEYRGQQAELARVQRYYQSVSAVYTVVSGGAYFQMPLVSTMRIAGALSVSASAGTPTPGGLTPNSAFFTMSWSSNYNTTVTVTADARL